MMIKKKIKKTKKKEEKIIYINFVSYKLWAACRSQVRFTRGSIT